MTHIATVLAVATVLMGLWTLVATLIFVAREEGGYRNCSNTTYAKK